MKYRAIVASVAFALAAGIAVPACQGGENPLPLPPTDGGSDASKDGAAGDAAAGDAAVGDAAKDAESTETSAEASAEGEAGSVGEAGPTEAGSSDGASDVAPPDANEE